MCTVITLQRPGRPWPLLLAANRDERLDRAWDPPGPYWPGVVGGRDRLGGGTWMALNAHGVVAAVLNRPGSLGPDPAKRSRGELPLLALAEPDAARAAAAVARLDPAAYRTFNLVVADRDAVWFVRNDGTAIGARKLPPGLHMVTALDPDDPASPRVARHLPRFAAAPSEPDAWAALLADRGGTRAEALCVPALDGFGTVCASVLRLGDQVDWRFAAGTPDRVPFRPVAPPAAPCYTPGSFT